jgi:hypothetical protein
MVGFTNFLVVCAVSLSVFESVELGATSLLLTTFFLRLLSDWKNTTSTSSSPQEEPVILTAQRQNLKLNEVDLVVCDQV